MSTQTKIQSIITTMMFEPVEKVRVALEKAFPRQAVSIECHENRDIVKVGGNAFTVYKR